jgi:hypothetical protein
MTAVEYRYNGLKITIPRPLVLCPTNMMSGRRRVYRLEREFSIYIRSDGAYENYEVPAGFATDLATIPLLAQVFVGGNDAPGVAEASVFHDWACVQGMPRSYANSKLFYLMLAFKAPYWKALAFYAAVSMFGYGSLVARVCKRIRGWLDLET